MASSISIPASLPGYLLLTLMTCGVDAACAQEGSPRPVDVFTRGTRGYHTYQIPAVVVTNEGTVRLSYDQGGTWTDGKLIHPGPSA